MKKLKREELLKLIDNLNLPITEYYILSSGTLLFYKLREEARDIDLCVSYELFDQLKEKYDLTENDIGQTGFYHITENIEIIPNSKENFQRIYKNGYPVEKLENILKFKQKRNAAKDKKDIEKIIKYLEKIKEYEEDSR